MKKILIAIIFTSMILLLTGCGVIGINTPPNNEDNQPRTSSSETTTAVAATEADETARNFPDEDAFIREVLKCISNGDYEKYYDDYYSKTIRSHFTVDKYTWISQIRTGAKNYNMRNFQIVDKLYSKKINNLWIYIISNDYTDESGRDQYAEAFFWVFIEDGNWVCCPEDDGNTYYDELVENGTFKLIDSGNDETTPEDSSNSSNENTYGQPMTEQTYDETESTSAQEPEKTIRKFSGTATLNSGHADIEVLGNSEKYSITIKVINNSSDTANFYLNEQNIIYSDGKSESINFFDNTQSGYAQIPSGSWTEVTVNLTEEQYNNMSGLKGMLYFQGFDGLGDNNYELEVQDEL